uniref:Transmembrane protein 131 n=1 Tax=Hucho hucho TaxID=62062 RepID=A0A4W5K893_9TELE
ARVVGSVENTLFINTSHHGVFTYQVFGVGIPNPYRLRPFIGARVPVNGSFSPLINIHNPHSEPLQVTNIHNPHSTSLSYCLWRWRSPQVLDQFIILSVEVEITSAPGIYSSTEMLDFGTLRSQDRPKRLNLHLLNSGAKDVPITVSKYTDDAIKQKRPVQFSGKITVKVKEKKSTCKLEVPYQAEVLQGYLGFDHTATLFHIRDRPVEPVNRPIFLTNTFNFAVRIHNVTLPDEANTMFSVRNLSAPVLIPPHESRYIFSLLFRPVRPSIHIDSNILLITNASKFHLPVRAYTGYLEPLVLSPSLKEHLLDFGVCSSTDFSSILFVVFNSNPIELQIKSWLVTGDSLSMELLRTERGNRTAALGRSRELHSISASQYKTVILSSGYYAAFRVTLEAHALEGMYDGAVHINTDYQILTIPVKAVIAVGKLNSYPEHIILPPSFPVSNFSEARPHGLVLQEDIWDADVDLHQKLLRRWRELKDRSGHQVEAVFEVGTDLQKTVQATVTAQQTWPSLVNASQQVTFPLTNTDSSSETEFVLENPADVPVYVQVLPLALYPNPSMFAGKLADWLPLGKLSNIDTESLEFQSSVMKGSSGFVEGSTRPFVYNVLLQPGEVKSFSLRFTPASNHSVSSLLIVRNNLTVIDMIVAHGQGTTESLMVAGNPPGPGSSLRFQMTEALLKDCTEKIKSKEPKYTLRKTFRVENTGLLPLYIRSAEINGQPCQGYGFKVLNCQQFALKPNASEDLVILFTPDFTSSRVIRELKLVTEGGSEFVFVLNASLPFHMLASCTETLPRPSWEPELYVIVSLVMSKSGFLFLLLIDFVLVSFSGNCYIFEKCNVFCLFSLNDFSDAHQNSTRGMYGSGSEVSRVRSRNSRASMDLDGQRARMGFGRSTIQASSSSSQLANGAPVSCQLTNRKARSSKGQQGGGLLDLQNGGPGSGSSLPHRRSCSGGEDPDYTSLLGAMDNDLDRPESPPLQEHNVSLSIQNNGSITLYRTTQGIFNTDSTTNTREPEDSCPFRLVKRLSNGSVSELGHSSSSEGEKEFAATEWDIPLLTKTTNQVDSLQKISLQTMNADAFLKRPISARTYFPPPSSASLVTRGTYSQVLNANSETNLKKAPGNKLANATSLPGKNGNPTFAAVAAGYDRSPGGSGPGKRAQGNTLAPMTSVESDRSDSSGLWSPIGFNSANSFSAFGPNNSFNLTGVFSGMSFPKTSEPQQPRPELSSVSSSIWDTASTSNPLHSWLSSSSSPTVPTASILGRNSNPWSTTTPFGSSIWSTSGDTALHSFTPTSTLPDLPSSAPATGLEPAPPVAPTEMSRSYNPWSMCPTVRRHSSEPWPNH